MKTTYKSLVVGLAGLVILQGCEGLWANKIQSTKVQDEIKNKESFFPETPAAIFVNAPSTQQRNVVAVKRDPAWTQETVPTMPVSGRFLHSIMKDLLGGTSVNYSFAQDEANTLVTAKLSGTVKDCLETISAATGLSYVVTNESVKWSQYLTESFPVAYIPGKYNYHIGSSGSEPQSASGSGGEQVTFGTDSKQFSNVTSDGSDAFDELSNVLGQIVGDFGEISISKTTSSVIVTTTRSRMERVKNYMAKVEKSLGRQIAFEIKILRFTSNSQGQAGIDWNAVQNKSTGVLKFNGGDLSSLGGSGAGAPITFAANKTVGSMSGSDVLLQILQEQGKVSVVNQPRIVTQINRVAELELSNLQGYIAKTSVTNNIGGISSGGSNPSVEMTPGVVQSGYSIYTIGNISGDDKVILHMASTYTDLIGITRKEVMTSAIESPQMTRNKMVNTVVLRNGATMIIGGLQLQSTSEDNASPFSPGFLPTRNAHRSSVTETIALVTPVIVNMD